MIIISRNENIIINFENIITIEVEANFNSEKNFSIMFKDVHSDEVLLGKYETEERAKEILEEIAYLYVINQSGSTIDSEYRKSICYEMPEK